jgi:hypothetical protein
MSWLGVENIDRFVYSMVTSPSYLTRWAAVEIVASIFDLDLGNRVWQYAELQL